MLTSCAPPITGSEDGDVLPEDEARRQPHPVHPEQGEAEGDDGASQDFGGDQREKHCCYGVFSAEPRRVPHVWILKHSQKHKVDVESLCDSCHKCS